MRLGFMFAILAVCGTAMMTPVATQAAAASSTVRAITAPGRDIIRVQTAGSTKIRKECEGKANKQNLKGLSHQAYVEKCMAALSFNTTYGTK